MGRFSLASFSSLSRENRLAVAVFRVCQAVRRRHGWSAGFVGLAAVVRREDSGYSSAYPKAVPPSLATPSPCVWCRVGEGGA
ncbi:MAG: hypothetical protein IPL87_05310 [Candidatus Moraniibacteriota bacterium]|nr:MAG: hypothetical protein IPL87_05310 [Candidatus Moranbacteria bacterium]